MLQHAGKCTAAAAAGRTAVPLCLLLGPKTLRNQENGKRDVIFQNPDPPEAPAPEIPYLESPAQSPLKSDLKSFEMKN